MNESINRIDCENIDQGGAPRTLRFVIMRYNPQDENSEPRLESFELQESDSMTLFIALNELRETQDPSLQFDFVCRAGICGSCAMLVNGKPGLACRTLTKDLASDIHLAPLPVFELIADLSVNTGKWMHAMNTRIENWVHTNTVETDINAIEEPMEPELAQDIYELERCIECGCCVAACGTSHMHENFLGAIGLNKIARFKLDPRDNRTDHDFYELIGDESGVFGCMTLLGCEDVCPKQLSLSTQIAYLRRKMTFLK